jgi:hypothetical protein
MGGSRYAFLPDLIVVAEADGKKLVPNPNFLV